MHVHNMVSLFCSHCRVQMLIFFLFRFNSQTTAEASAAGFVPQAAVPTPLHWMIDTCRNLGALGAMKRRRRRRWRRRGGGEEPGAEYRLFRCGTEVDEICE